MSEQQQQAEAQAPALPRVRVVDLGNGPVYVSACAACGRQVVERKSGQTRCVCGAAVELKP